MTDRELYELLDRLFEQKPASGTIQINPVTGGRWVAGLDSKPRQYKEAAKALRAAAFFKRDTGGTLPDLPLNYDDREDLKRTGVPLNYVISLYARSVFYNGVEPERHPRFVDFAAGVLASPLAPPWVRQDPELLRRYPPTELPGLGNGCIWRRDRRRRRT